MEAASQLLLQPRRILALPELALIKWQWTRPLQEGD